MPHHRKDMNLYHRLLILVIILPFAQSAFVLKPISSINIPFAYSDAGVGLYGVDQGSIEQSAYDVDTGLVYVAGESFIHIVDYSNLTNPSLLDYIPSQPINDVEQCGSMVAFLVPSTTPDLPGEVHLYNLYNLTTGSFEMAYAPIKVGFSLDVLHFTKDCNTIVTADEGEPYETSSGIIDPEGSVSIIRLDGISPTVKTLDFTSFNARAVEYVASGVRQAYAGELSPTPSTFSQSLEPEFITFNTGETKAYVGLQENNAIAEVNLLTDTIDEIYPLGVKSWKDLGLDASDKDGGINLQNYDIYSLYQPDGIQFFDSNGKGYIITANEGDVVEFEADGEEYADNKRGRQLLQDGDISADLDPALLQALADDSKLGRLKFSTIDGFSASDPTKIDQLYFFGGRGISIYQADDMKQVWDSGDQIERKHAELYPDIFNAGEPEDPNIEIPKDLVDKKSASHGPEPESLEIGELEDSTRLVFIGMDSTGAIAVFKLEEPTTEGSAPGLVFESMYRAGGINETFTALLEKKNLGNLDPENLRFIPAAKRLSTDNALLLVSGAKSGNLVMYEIFDDGKGAESGSRKCRKNNCSGSTQRPAPSGEKLRKQLSK